MSVKLESGAHNHLPHYAVIGDATDFYVWVNEATTEEGYDESQQGSSTWIKGRPAFAHYNQLRQLHDNKKWDEFKNLIKQLRKDYDRLHSKG